MATKVLSSVASSVIIAQTLAFQCTGFDPVYDPRDGDLPLTKREAYALGLANDGRANVRVDGRARNLADEFARHAHRHSRANSHFHSHSHSLRAPVNLALQPFALDKVALEPGSLLDRKQQVNNDYLLFLDPDSLLYIFRNTSGLDTKGASPFGGWEDPNCLLRGHFAGHWLSASAIAANSTGNATIRANANYVIAELAKCAAANAALYGPVPGYLSGFPASQFDDLEHRKYSML